MSTMPAVTQGVEMGSSIKKIQAAVTTALNEVAWSPSRRPMNTGESVGKYINTYG